MLKELTESLKNQTIVMLQEKASENINEGAEAAKAGKQITKA
jgi:hypothetical protein